MRNKFVKPFKWVRKRKLSKLTLVSESYRYGLSWGPYVDIVHNKTGKRFWWDATSSLDVEVTRPDGTAGVPADVATEVPKSPRLPWRS